MNCLVCKKDYEAAECPRCKFPHIQVPATAPADFLASLQPTIADYRRKFLQKLQLQIPIYHWKDQGGVVVEDRVEMLSLGSADQMLGRELWVEKAFARIPDEKEITVTVRISVNGESWEQTVSVPNLHKPELQKIGATIDDNHDLRLMLRNETENSTVSDPVPLFQP